MLELRRFKVTPVLIAGWISSRAVYGLALIPVLTNWLASGSWPRQPRELAIELVLGAVIFLAVHGLLYRTALYRAAAETDPLTGLANRRRFRIDFEAAVTRARKRNESSVLAFVDVDHFKAINDTRGHAAGDDALKLVGRGLARSLRQGQDLCYRLGGDEFAVLLANVSESQALQILQRGFDRADHEAHRELGPRLSCSVGLVSFSRDAQPHELLARADQRMYWAKRVECESETLSLNFGRLSLVPRQIEPDLALHLSIIESDATSQ